MSGKFIVFEGLDGCGKTTQIGLLRDYLLSEGIGVFVTAEPTDGDTGRLLRKILGGKISSNAREMATLFTADRIAHNVGEGGIKEHLANGDIIICDRYYYSTLAYQGIDTGLDDALKMTRSCPSITVPDLCIFLEADTKTCIERITKGRSPGELEIFETAEKLESVRRRFDEAFAALRSENIVRIDASGTVTEVFESVKNAVKQIL